MKRERYAHPDQQQMIDGVVEREKRFAVEAVAPFARAKLLGVNRVFVGSGVLGYEPSKTEDGMLRPAARPLVEWLQKYHPTSEIVIVPDENQKLSAAGEMAGYLQDQFKQTHFYQLDPDEVDRVQPQIEADVAAGRYVSSMDYRESGVRPLTTSRGGLAFVATLDAFSHDHKVLYLGNRQISRCSYMRPPVEGSKDRHMIQLFNGWHLTLFHQLPPRTVSAAWQQMRQQKERGFSRGAIRQATRDDTDGVKRTIYRAPYVARKDRP